MSNNLINSPEAKKRFNNKLSEISASFTRVEAERDLVKTIVSDLAEEFQIDKKIVNLLARTYHKSDFKEKVAEKTEFEIIYETITGESPETADTYNGEDGE